MTLENFKLPAGRIVGGDPNKFEQAIDYYTKQPKMDRNGQPLKEFRIDLAINKADFMQQVWPFLVQEVGKIYSQYANMNPEQLDMSKFAWKIINGDSTACPQGSNVPYNTRDGYAGCYIIKIRTSAFKPRMYKFENGAYHEMAENEVKTGDWIEASVNITVHNEKDGGIYWNPNCFNFLGYGQPIKGTGGADPMKAFGNQAPTLPAGASATPISAAPATAQMPTAMQAAQPMQAAPVAMPQPAYDFVANAGMPQAAPMQGAVPVAQGFTGAAPAATMQPSSTAMGVSTAPNAQGYLINR